MTRVEKAKVAGRRAYGGKSAEQRRHERRTAFVDAGRVIWLEQGWAAVTMRGVCARAGYADRYFYENFTDRDDLLATVWDGERDDLIRLLLDVVTTGSELKPLEQLREAISAVVHVIADEPARAQILFGDHAGSAVLEQRRREAIQQATELLIAVAGPYLRKDLDAQAFRINVLVGIGGFVELMLAWRSGLVDADTDTVIEHLFGVGNALAPRFLQQEIA